MTVGPGGTATVTVREPAMNIKVTRANSQSGAPAFPTAHAVIKSASAGCNDRFEFNALSAAAELPELGLPFGTYALCADDSVLYPTNPANARRTTVNITLNDPAGLNPQQTIWIKANGTAAGKCT